MLQTEMMWRMLYPSDQMLCKGNRFISIVRSNHPDDDRIKNRIIQIKIYFTFFLSGRDFFQSTLCNFKICTEWPAEAEQPFEPWREV